MKSIKCWFETMTFIYEKRERNKIQPKCSILIKELNKKYFLEKQHDIHKGRVFYDVPTWSKQQVFQLTPKAFHPIRSTDRFVHMDHRGEHHVILKVLPDW